MVKINHQDLILKGLPGGIVKASENEDNKMSIF